MQQYATHGNVRVTSLIWVSVKLIIYHLFFMIITSTVIKILTKRLFIFLLRSDINTVTTAIKAQYKLMI